MSDGTVIESCAVATADGSGAEYASGHIVAGPMLVSRELVVEGGELRTADEREIARELASRRLIKKTGKLMDDSVRPEGGQ